MAVNRFSTLSGLQRPLSQGDLSELRLRQARFIDRLGANYRDIIIYQDGAGRLIITSTGSDGTAPTIIGTYLNTLEFSGGTPAITSLTYPSILDLLGVGEVVRAGYFASRRVAKTLAGNGETIAVGGAGTSGFVALSDGGAARTGLIIAAGGYDGQMLVIAHVGSNTITFNTTEATSRVAGSATFGIISPLMAVFLIWDATTARWYPVRPLT